MSGHFAYTLAIPPATEPMTVDDAKRHCRMDADIPDEDGLVLSWITAARMQVERDTELKLLSQTWDLALDAFPWDGGPVLLLTGPVQSVTSVKYYDVYGTLQTMSSAGYITDVASQPARIGLVAGYIWPANTRLFQPALIRFVAGYASADLIPEPLIRAMALLVGWFAQNREPAPFERAAYEALISGYVLPMAC